jgi:tetratricopeptide (TPR) repeat protein
LEEWVLRRVLTTKEKIQLYLLENRLAIDEFEAPEYITQTGIAEGIGILPSHFSQYMKPLLEGRLVRERTSRIKGGKRKRKVYSLEKEGIEEAARLKVKLMDTTVRFYDLEGRISEGKVSDVVESVGKVSLVLLVDELERSEVLDPTLLRRRPARREVRPVDFSRTSPRSERFCGRELEKKSISEAIERGRVVVIQGIAGIGKTALASRVCSDVKKKRSVFWYEFRRWHSLWGLLSDLSKFLEAMSAKNLGNYLKAEGSLDMGKVASALEEDLETERAALFFDDFQMANEEIMEFFRHLGSIAKRNKELAIIVLTREFNPFYDRKDVEVDHHVEEFQISGLDKVSSRELLGEGIDEFDRFDEVYAATQGHPLFLELLSSVPVIGTKPRLKYIDQFIEEEIYAELEREEKMMMKVSSVFENPVHISKLLFDESLDIEIFFKLKKKALIGILEDGRVQVHDMIRKPFMSMLTPQERERYHLWAAESLLKEEEEILQIEAVHHLLVTGDHSWAARVLEEKGERLVENGFDEELLLLLMEFDPRLMEQKEKAVIMEREGDILRSRGQIDDSVKKYKESRTSYDKGDDTEGLARTGRKIGSVYRSIGKFEEGLKAYTKALSVIGKDSETIEAARVMGGIGSIMARKGRFEKAVEYLLKDLAIAKDKGDRKEIARVFNRLSYIFYETGAHDKALEFQKMSLKTKERILEEWRKYSEL